MSKNNVHPDHYKVGGRDRQDDAAAARFAQAVAGKASSQQRPDRMTKGPYFQRPEQTPSAPAARPAKPAEGKPAPRKSAQKKSAQKKSAQKEPSARRGAAKKTTARKASGPSRSGTTLEAASKRARARGRKSGAGPTRPSKKL